MQTSIARYSELERTKRIDAEFFWPVFLDLNKVLSAKIVQPLTALCKVSDGNHMSVAHHFQTENGIPYFRGQDINTDFFIENAKPTFIPENIYARPYMRRSWIQEGDILLSIVGTIGSLSIVTEKVKKSTGSCKIAILRPKKKRSGYIASFLQSKYGQFQIKRNTRGAVQQGLLLEDMEQIQVYIPSEELEKSISKKIQDAIELNRFSKDKYKDAQTLLLSELGLADWQPKRRLTFVKSHCEVEKAERADAEYFQPKYEEIKEAIKRYPGRWARLGELCELVGHPSNPPYSDAESKDKTFIVVQKHLGDFTLTDAYWSDADSKHTTKEFLKKNAQYLLQKKDLVLYTVGGAPHIGKANIIFDDRIPATIGSFVTLVRANENKINPFLLLVLFNSPIGYLLTNRFQRGMVQQYIYPKDLVQTVIPIVREAIQVQIEQKVVDAFNLQEQSRQLLECAKRAVEIAIEQNEQTAIDWLEHETKGFHS